MSGTQLVTTADPKKTALTGRSFVVQQPFLPDTVEVPSGILEGEVQIPPSKSISHRLMILAALNRKPACIENVLRAQDTEITFRGLRAMGYTLEWEKQTVRVNGWAPGEQANDPLWVGNSGSSARFLLAVAALTPGQWLLDGTPRMRQRPMRPLIEALQQLGARIRRGPSGWPIRVEGGLLHGGAVSVDCRQSSQFVSALLLIAPFLSEGLTLHWGQQGVSLAYIHLTLRLLRQAGIQFDLLENGVQVAGGQALQKTHWQVEGDFSSASYFLAGAGLSGGRIRCLGLEPDSAQGDRQIVDLLAAMGMTVSWEEGALVASGEPPLRPLEANLRDCPDLAPTLAVAALFARGPSVLRNVGHLSLKESDRLRSLAQNIRRLGGRVSLRSDELIIHPANLRAALLPAYQDHRIAMAFALVGLRVPGVIIDQANVVEKSFPRFWELFLPLISASGRNISAGG